MRRDLAIVPPYIDGTCFEEPDPPAPVVSLWDPIPLGVGNQGEPVTLSLPQRNLLVGGIPGSGKSAAMSLLLAAAALDYGAEMYLIDGKMVEFAVWEDCATGFAHRIEDAIDLLGLVQGRMQSRLEELHSTWKSDPRRGVRAIRRDQYSLIVVLVDELALFTADQNPKHAKEFVMRLTDLVARGRAPGVIVCAATQKPDGNTVPTHLRDLFAYRLALCCSTPEASDTILGRGWAAQGYNAQDIAIGTPGLGYLLEEDGKPRRIRTYYLGDDDVRAYAAWARKGRQLL